MQTGDGCAVADVLGGTATNAFRRSAVEPTGLAAVVLERIEEQIALNTLIIMAGLAELQEKGARARESHLS